MPQFKSRIWKYFKVSSDNEMIAECILCLEQSSSSKIVRGKTPKLFSTKPLWNHLKYKHPLVYKSLNENKVDGNENYISTFTNKPNDEALQEQPEQQICYNQHQLTLQMTIDRSKQWHFNDPKAKAISRKICK